jgi:hypothetical protein
MLRIQAGNSDPKALAREEELAELGRDIALHGQLEPIVLFLAAANGSST